MKFKITSDLKNIKQASDKILRCLDARQLDPDLLFDLRLACEEAIINAIKYGNKLKADRYVEISCEVSKGAVLISVEDRGRGFNWKNLPDPTKPENLIKGCGRGLFLIQNIMDKVEFNTQGNRITMTKFLSKKGVEKCK